MKLKSMSKAFVFMGALIGLAATSSHAAPGDGKACVADALQLLNKQYPQGTLVYSKLANMDYFADWLRCGEEGYGLPSAIHESTHEISDKANNSSEDETFSLFMPNGQMLTVPSLKTFNRNVIVQYLKENEKDHYQALYLVGTEGEKNFWSLVDELNAYTHGLMTSNRIYAGHAKTPHNYRDGVARLMQYLELYLFHARTKETAVWNSLVKSQEAVTLVATLWQNAQNALSEACQVGDAGFNSLKIADTVYSDLYIGEMNRFMEASGKTLFANSNVNQGCPDANLVKKFASKNDPSGIKQSDKASDPVAPKTVVKELKTKPLTKPADRFKYDEDMAGEIFIGSAVTPKKEDLAADWMLVARTGTHVGYDKLPGYYDYGYKFQGLVDEFDEEDGSRTRRVPILRTGTETLSESTTGFKLEKITALNCSSPAQRGSKEFARECPENSNFVGTNKLDKDAGLLMTFVSKKNIRLNYACKIDRMEWVMICEVTMNKGKKDENSFYETYTLLPAEKKPEPKKVALPTVDSDE